MKPKVPADHHRHDRESVETVGDVDRISGTHHHETAEHDEEPSKMSSFEKGSASLFEALGVEM